MSRKIEWIRLDLSDTEAVFEADDGNLVPLWQAEEIVATLQAENEALREALDDLIPLAEFSMQQANRDGGEFDIEEDLRDARALLAKEPKA